jgi:hypothetical protein
MSTHSDGGPAFPVSIYKDCFGSPRLATEYDPTASGMSLRDYFAGQALAGLCQGARGSGYNKAELSRYAFAAADAMLAARERKADK